LTQAEQDHFDSFTGYLAFNYLHKDDPAITAEYRAGWREALNKPEPADPVKARIHRLVVSKYRALCEQHGVESVMNP